MSGLPPDSGESYKVIQPYLPQHDGEIELVIGDIITNVKDLNNGWTLGRNASRDTVGIFPSGFIVDEIDEDDTEVKTPIDVDDLPAVLNIAKERAKSQERAVPPPVAPKPGVVPPVKNTHNQDFHREHPGPPHTYERLHSREGTPIGGNPNDPYEDDLMNALEDSELEDYITNSLKKGNRGKPHMFVKPNPGKSLFRDQSDSAAKLAMSDSEMPDSPMSGGNKNYGASTNSTPINRPQSVVANVQQGRLIGTPPTVKHVVKIGDARKGRDPIITDQVVPVELPGASGTLAPTSRDQSGPHEDQTSPGLTSLEQTERQNVRNENIHRNSPKLPQKGADGRFYQDYRTLECPVDGPLKGVKYKPILKNRSNGHYYGSPGRAGEIYYTQQKEDKTVSRLVLSVVAGLLLGLVLFLLMNYALEYSVMISLITSIAVAVILCIFFAISRLCRCVGALLVPSICTTRGRIAFLIIISGFLLDGPVTNVYLNMAEVSRSLSCSAEQSYNQSMLLLQVIFYYLTLFRPHFALK